MRRRQNRRVMVQRARSHIRSLLGLAVGAAAMGRAPVARAQDQAQAQLAPPAASDPAASSLSPATVTPRLLIQSDAVVWHHGLTSPAREDAEAHPGLYLRRARGGAEAEAGPWMARVIFEAVAQPDVVSSAPAPAGGAQPGATDLDAIAGALGGGTSRVTEAFVALAPNPAWTLAAGVMRVPVGLSRQIDEADLRLPERARFVTRTTPDYRPGLAVHGDLGLIQYAAGAYAAAPDLDAQRASLARGGALYLLRLATEPVGPVGLAPQLRRRADPWWGWWRFSAGMTALRAQLPGADESGLGGDAQFQWRGLCVTGEILWTRRSAVDRVGFSAEPGVFLIADKLELVTRLEWFNDQVGPTGPLDAWGVSAGATVLSASRHARAQIAYTWRRPWDGGEAGAGWALLRATFTL